MSNTESDNERVVRAIAEVQRVREEFRVAAAARLARMEKDGEAAIEETRKRVQHVVEEEQARLRHQLEHTPTKVDVVTDISFTPNGKPRLSEATRIHKWNDGSGNIVYTSSKIGEPTGVSSDDIRALSVRISAQQAAFEQLDPEEQSGLFSRFNTSEGAESGAEPYRDYLHSEALGKRFYDLTQTPPRPS